jgi:hypothetical protein
MRETTKSPNFADPEGPAGVEGAGTDGVPVVPLEPSDGETSAGQTDNRDAIATHYSDFHTLSQRVMDHARFIRIRRN